MINKLYDLTPLCTLIRMFPTVDFVISELNVLILPVPLQH